MIEERARQRLPCVSGLRVSQRRNYSILVWNETSLQGFRKASKRRYGNVRSPYGREVAISDMWHRGPHVAFREITGRADSNSIIR